MDRLKKTRLVLMGLTLMVIWAGAMAFEKIWRPELKPERTRLNSEIE